MTDDFAWLAAPGGAATGIGSLPGEDIAESARFVFGELPDLPYLPELPGRGPGADLIGRTAGAILVDLYVDIQPTGWRLVDRPGVDQRRARDLLARDLDALEEAAVGYTGPVKAQVAGPWTLAAALERTRGDRAVADLGACRDLAQSLAEGAANHVRELRRRVPGARVVLQVDEPTLPAVLAGRVPTASGYATLRAVAEPDARAGLAEVFGAPDAPVVAHCCDRNPPLATFRAAGAAAVAFDAALTGPSDDLGEAVEAGGVLFAGLVPATETAGQPDPKRAARAGRELWRGLGFAPERFATQVVVTPTCGMAGASPTHARAATRASREAAKYLADPDTW